MTRLCQRTRPVWATCLALLSVSAIYSGAQEAESANTPHRYALIDLGTLGGRQSYLNFYAHVLNSHGVIGALNRDSD